MYGINSLVFILIHELKVLAIFFAELEALIVLLNSAYLRLVLFDQVLPLLELRRLRYLAHVHRVVEMR